MQELLDREAIRQTQARYNTGGDSVNYDELGNAFTEDGVILLAGGGFSHEGRQSIIKGMRAKAMARGAGQAGIFQRHQLTTSRVEFRGPDEATGRTYFFVVTELGPDHSGVYYDQFRRVGDSWLISRREIALEWRRAGSRFGPAIGASQ